MPFYLVLFIISYPYLVLCVDSAPGHAVPHADILDEILSAHITNNSLYDPDRFTEFLVGNETKPLDPENMAMNILDVDSVKKIISSVRRQNIFMKQDYKDTMAFRNNSVIVETAMRLMQQSIYNTRFRIRSTKSVRDKFAKDASFGIAVLYGASRQMLQKMEHLYAQMNNMFKETHFVWFLIIYEKLLAYNVDISDSVRKIFQMHEKFVTDNTDVVTVAQQDVKG